MTKDEMKDRISMALKDPILQQGFEIICKENVELKEKLEHRNCVDCSNHGSNIKLLKAKELLRIGMEGIKREFLFDGNGNRPFEEEARNICNLFYEKAEQFLKEVSK